MQSVEREEGSGSRSVEGSPIDELGLDVENGGDVWTGHALVPAGGCAPGTRFPLASVLIIYADIVSGMQARARTLPNMSVTVDLSLDVMVPDPGRTMIEEVSLRSRILRGGKRSIVTEATFHAAGGDVVAVCTGNFAPISSTMDAMVSARRRRPPRHERRLLAVPLAERVGLKVPSPGEAEIVMGAGMGNSTQSLMGGFTALLAESAALSRCAVDTGRPHLADRLHIRYLAPILTGPARAAVRMQGGDEDRRLLFVDVRDSARAEDTAADVTVSCRPVG